MDGAELDEVREEARDDATEDAEHVVLEQAEGSRVGWSHHLPAAAFCRLLIQLKPLVAILVYNSIDQLGSHTSHTATWWDHCGSGSSPTDASTGSTVFVHRCARPDPTLTPFPHALG